MPLVPPPMLINAVFGGNPVMLKVTVCPGTTGIGDMVTFGFGRTWGRKYPMPNPVPKPTNAIATVFPLVYFFLLSFSPIF